MAVLNKAKIPRRVAHLLALELGPVPGVVGTPLPTLTGGPP